MLNTCMIIDHAFFEDEYHTLRKLSTDERVYREYELTWQHIQSVRPIDTKTILLPNKNKTLTNASSFDIIDKNNKNSTWPCVVKYPEQLLGVDEIYVVTVSSTRMMVDHDDYGRVEVIRIEFPVVISPAMITNDEVFPFFTTVEEYRDLETRVDWHRHMVIERALATREDLQANKGRCIPMIHLNLLPSSPRTYNTVFYDEGVANFFADSVRELYKKT